MENHLVLHTTLSIIILLFTATFISFVLKRSRLPYTVILVLAGILLGFLSSHYSELSFLKEFKLSPELIFYIFLPTLIFESSFHTNIRHFTQNIATTSILATLGMLVSTFLVALGMVHFLNFPWGPSLLFGSLISATDPVSVLSLFKKIGAPKRLAVIVEGESLFNDGTALVLFGIFLEGFRGLSSTLQSFFSVSLGGILVGLIFGFLFSKALDYVKNSKEIEISITLILAHATFIVAEYFFGVSGILATVAAGIVIGNYGAYKISPGVKEIMTHFWDYSAFIANSILFLLVGFIIFNNAREVYYLLEPLSIIIVLVLAARAIMVYLLMPLINIIFPQERVPFAWMHVIQWSGLKGALGIALILTLPPEFPYQKELLIFTVGVIFFTIIFNGLTIGPLLKICGLRSFSTLDSFKYDEHRVLIGQKVNSKLTKMLEKSFISKEVHDYLQKDYRNFCRQGTEDIKRLFKDCKSELNTNNLKQVLKIHLLEIEQTTFAKLYYQGEITQNLLITLLNNIDEQRTQRDNKKVKISLFGSLSSRFILVKIIDKLGLKSFKEKITKQEFFIRYEMYRARIIGTSEVLAVIKDIKKTNTFLDKNIINEFESKYKDWQKNAQKKLADLKKNNSTLANNIEIYLARQAAFHLEKKMIGIFKKREYLSMNIINELEEDLERREDIATYDLKKLNI